VAEREARVRRGLQLEYLTLGYNVAEAALSLWAGVWAGSVALVGFGIDSVIETLSGAIMLWRLHVDSDASARARNERRAQRLIAVSFLLLAAYVAYESAETLWRREAPERSLLGIAVAAASILIMPQVARAKRRIGRAIESAAMVADSKQTELCAWLSVILLAGLGLNALFGWWWADPAAGLAMTPIIAKEGWNAWRGEGCGCAAGRHV
jgi:divalent metal cation (Fe/Co/Zn/Cd) transporter